MLVILSPPLLRAMLDALRSRQRASYSSGAIDKPTHPSRWSRPLSRSSITGKKIDGYYLQLQEKYRPPSRGGNTSARHSHVLVIDGERYSFLAQGSQRWVFKGDTVSFEYVTNGPYRNIVKETLQTLDRYGNSVVRGKRGFKRKLRTADARLPGSRRERAD
jgi:hypothetical protein